MGQITFSVDPLLLSAAFLPLLHWLVVLEVVLDFFSYFSDNFFPAPSLSYISSSPSAYPLKTDSSTYCQLPFTYSGFFLRLYIFPDVSRFVSTDLLPELHHQLHLTTEYLYSQHLQCNTSKLNSSPHSLA